MSIRLELDFDTAAVRLRAEWGVPHELRIAFRCGPEERWIAGNVAIRQSALSLDYAFTCCGWDLAEFAGALRRFARSQDGAAEFVNQAGNVTVRLRPFDVSRGAVAVDAVLQQHMASPLRHRDEHPLLELSGFGVDQSELGELAARIDAFLLESGAPVTHPMAERVADG